MKDKKIENMPEADAQMEKRIRIKSAAGSRRGAYTAALSAIVIAIVIVFNLFSAACSRMLEFDISSNKRTRYPSSRLNF